MNSALCSFLCGVQEVWPVVTKSFDFFLGFVFDPVVPLACPPGCILPLKQEMHDCTTCYEKCEHVGDNCRVASRVLWGQEEDVAAYNAIDIAPTDDKAENNATLINAFNVIAHPRDCV
jgi:hypothetical protein